MEFLLNCQHRPLGHSFVLSKMTLGIAAYRQQATYWGAPVQSGFGGISFGTPTLIMCRWEDRVESFTNSTGNEVHSKSIVYVLGPYDIGGYLVRGDHTNVSDPTTMDAALEIQRCDDIPDLRGLNNEYRVFL